MTDAIENETALVTRLRAIVGNRHVLTQWRATRGYRSGFRTGGGDALAVVRPGHLVEMWRVINACVVADAIIIMQAANTSLTGGATPHGSDYDRPVVIISGMRIRQFHLLEDGTQVLCFPGTTLDQLERALGPIGREPHSVIGSSCIGASVFGGVCNNSGGALVQRGPAYTELALFAWLDADRQVRLVNHLGIELGDDPEEMLARLDDKTYCADDVQAGAGLASDRDYDRHVRAIDANTPARFNADPRMLFEASGSAGKLAVFAIRLDTFPVENDRQLFYLGTNSPDVLTDLRRAILCEFKTLPVSAEYIHRDAFAIAKDYGKDTVLAISWLGTRRLPAFFAFKKRLDVAFDTVGVFPKSLCDRVLQWLSRLVPAHLPERLVVFHRQFEHHLLLLTAGKASAQGSLFLEEYFANHPGAYFKCSPIEQERALLHRFAVAGAAVRYRTVHSESVEDIVALDVALRRNDADWHETLVPEVADALIHKLYYGHFLCHVFHRDYIVRKGENTEKIKSQLLAFLDSRGAEYPAEHNVGHLYRAKPELAEFYKRLDPLNGFNPGIGMTSKRRRWE